MHWKQRFKKCSSYLNIPEGTILKVRNVCYKISLISDSIQSVQSFKVVSKKQSQEAVIPY